MGINEKVKKDLLRYMEVNNMTANQFALKVGVAPSSITRFLKGSFNASIKLLEIIAKEIDGKLKYYEFK